MRTHVKTISSTSATAAALIAFAALTVSSNAYGANVYAAETCKLIANAKFASSLGLSHAVEVRTGESAYPQRTDGSARGLCLGGAWSGSVPTKSQGRYRLRAGTSVVFLVETRVPDTGAPEEDQRKWVEKGFNTEAGELAQTIIPLKNRARRHVLPLPLLGADRATGSWASTDFKGADEAGGAWWRESSHQIIIIHLAGSKQKVKLLEKVARTVVPTFGL
jgi:hypothetical protein